MQRKKFRIPRKKISKLVNTNIQKRLEELHVRIRVELAGRTSPDPAEAICQGREERDKQLLNSLKLTE
jgi:hypothetical protein